MFLNVLKLLKFGVVGGVGMCIDFGLTWICKEKIKINKYLANAIGFSVAVISNYILNKIWTFNNSNPNWAKLFFIFLGISLIGLVLNTSIIYLLHQKKHINFYIAKFLAILIVFIWNFFLNSYLTFKV